MPKSKLEVAEEVKANYEALMRKFCSVCDYQNKGSGMCNVLSLALQRTYISRDYCRAGQIKGRKDLEITLYFVRVGNKKIPRDKETGELGGSVW
jgi:hypothetical protein